MWRHNVDLLAYHDLDGRSGFKLALQEVDGRFFLLRRRVLERRRHPRHAAVKRSIDSHPLGKPKLNYEDDADGFGRT